MVTIGDQLVPKVSCSIVFSFFVKVIRYCNKIWCCFVISFHYEQNCTMCAMLTYQLRFRIMYNISPVSDFVWYTSFTCYVLYKPFTWNCMNHLLRDSMPTSLDSQHVGAVFPMFLSLGVLLFLRGHPSVKIPHPIVTGAQEEARPLVAGSSKFIADQMRRPNLGPQRH